MVIHVVAPGDTLWAIASRYGVPMAAIVSANAIADPNVLVVGEALAIPLPAAQLAPLRYVVSAVIRYTQLLAFLYDGSGYSSSQRDN